MDKPLYTRYRWLILAITGAAFMSVYIDMIVYAPILEDISVALNVDMGIATNLMMGFVLATAVVLPWGGVICDKYGITAALVMGLLCASLPATLMPWVGNSYGIVFACRLIQGASVGFTFSVIGPALALWFPQHEHGLAGGLMMGSASLGSGIGVYLSPVIFSRGYSWQAVIALLSVLGWGAMLLAIVFMSQVTSGTAIKGENPDKKVTQERLTLIKLLGTSTTCVIVLIMFCNAWALYCIYNLTPPYLTASRPLGVGLGSVTSGEISLAMICVGIFATVVGGIFFDRAGKEKSSLAITMGFFITGVFVYLVLVPVVNSNMALLIISLMMAGWGIPFMNASVSALIVTNYPQDMVGRIIGLVFGLGTLGGALGIYVAGRSIESSGNFRTAIVMISVVAFIGAILSFFIKPKRQTIDPEMAK